MNDYIITLIDRYARDGDFTHVSLTPDALKSAQERLGLTMPSQYIDYLKAYGHGGICGVEILGVGLTGKLLFLETTSRYRKCGLPLNLLAIENCDEWLYCIDCDSGKVVSWSQIDGVRDEYPSFDDFLLQEFNDAIENL